MKSRIIKIVLVIIALCTVGIVPYFNQAQKSVDKLSESPESLVAPKGEFVQIVTLGGQEIVLDPERPIEVKVTVNRDDWALYIGRQLGTGPIGEMDDIALLLEVPACFTRGQCVPEYSDRYVLIIMGNAVPIVNRSVFGGYLQDLVPGDVIRLGTIDGMKKYVKSREDLQTGEKVIMVGVPAEDPCDKYMYVQGYGWISTLYGRKCNMNDWFSVELPETINVFDQWISK